MPDLQIVTAIPKDLPPQAIDTAVKAFIADSGVLDFEVDAQGLFNDTIQAIASATYFKTPGKEFWLSWHEGTVVAYVLATICPDVDQRLTYHLQQCWVTPQLRRNKVVKVWMERLRQRAKDTLCKHIVVTSCRNSEAYLRFLGNGFKQYYTLLKEDI
jgi:hypothetical protein